MAQQVVMCLAALRLALRARRLAVPERRCREQHTARASGGRMSTVLNALYDRRGCDSFCFPALCPAAFGGFTYVRPLSLGVSSRSLGLRRVPSMARLTCPRWSQVWCGCENSSAVHGGNRCESTLVCVSSWFRIKNTHSHARHNARLQRGTPARPPSPSEPTNQRRKG